MNSISRESKSDITTESEQRSNNMPIESESSIPAGADYITAPALTSETPNQILITGNDNDSENDDDASIVSNNEDDGTYEKVKIRAAMKKYYDEGKLSLQEWNTEIACHKLALDKLQVSFTHESVYKAFRSIVFFACECLDNLDEAIDYFTTEKWDAAKSRGSKYRTPVALILVASGASEESLIGDSTLCIYAKMAESLHAKIRDGSITYENFIDRVCKRRGGIQGYYRSIGKDDGDNPDDDGPDDDGGNSSVGKSPDGDGSTGTVATKPSSQIYVVVFRVDEAKNPKPASRFRRLKDIFKDEYQTCLPISDDALALITEESAELNDSKTNKRGMV